MRTGYLHIRKANQQPNWVKEGYGQMTVLPQCFTTRLIPFYFRHITSGSIGDGDSCNLFSIEKLKNDSVEVVEKTISLVSSDITYKEDSGVIMYYFGATQKKDLGAISAGIYRFKIITFDDKTYYSEPFQISFDQTESYGTFGAFSNDFSNDFDV